MKQDDRWKWPISVCLGTVRRDVERQCGLLENQAISEIARARCTGSFGMSCGAYLAAT